MTFVDWDDLHRWSMINKALDLGIPEAAETYSSSEHFYKEMHIPANATGRLPKSSQTREGLSAEKVEDLGETGKNHRGGSDHGRSSAGHGGGGHGVSGRSGGPSSRGKRSGTSSDKSSSESRERPAADRPKTTDETKPRRSRNRRRTHGGQGDSAGAGAATA